MIVFSQPGLEAERKKKPKNINRKTVTVLER
jgi:hypothetical protein